MNRVLRYENVTAPGGPLTFADRGPLLTASGAPVVGRVSFADWDGDGRTDVLAAWDGLVALHRNLGDRGRDDAAGGRRLPGGERRAAPARARARAGGRPRRRRRPRPGGGRGGRAALLVRERGHAHGAAPHGRAADRLPRLHGRVPGREGRRLRRRRPPRHPGRPRVGARAPRRTSRACSDGCSATWARARRRGSRRATRRAARRTWSACSPRTPCGRTACARWTGTRDGLPDLLAGDSDGYVRLFRNLGPRPGPSSRRP